RQGAPREARRAGARAEGPRLLPVDLLHGSRRPPPRDHGAHRAARHLGPAGSRRAAHAAGVERAQDAQVRQVDRAAARQRPRHAQGKRDRAGIVAAHFGKLVAIDVKPGGPGDSQSGLNLLQPRIWGRLADEGCGRDLAFVVIHPSSNFHGHYLVGPLESRGVALLALNTRYAGNDATLLMERCIQDLGAGVAFLRAQGYRKVVLIGNSGGGSLVSFYQSQAERLTIRNTPDGRLIDLAPEDLPK